MRNVFVGSLEISSRGIPTRVPLIVTNVQEVRRLAWTADIFHCSSANQASLSFVFLEDLLLNATGPLGFRRLGSGFNNHEGAILHFSIESGV